MSVEKEDILEGKLLELLLVVSSPLKPCLYRSPHYLSNFLVEILSHICGGVCVLFCFCFDLVNSFSFKMFLSSYFLILHVIWKSYFPHCNFSSLLISPSHNRMHFETDLAFASD